MDFKRFRQVAIIGVGLVLVSLVGCAKSAWRSALSEDTPAAYYRFMRDYPNHPRYEVQVEERLAFHKLKRDPSLAGYEEFRARYPGSALLAELQPLLAEQAFAAARAAGTPEAYAKFNEAYPATELAVRALGNQTYLEAQGYGGDPKQLAAFAQEHPKSDFAAEAQRTADGVQERERSRFDRVGLVVRISASTPEERRLIQEFRDRATATYARAGIELVPVPEMASTQSAGLPRARLTIEYSEEAVQTEVDGNALSRPGHVATTRVTLRENPQAAPIWERSFQIRLDTKDYSNASSIVFAPAAGRFWNEFFVPVARWQTQTARRAPILLEGQVVAVDGAGDRVVALFDNGDFQLIELADPSAAEVLIEYERPRDFTRWSGLQIVGDKVAVYGDDGLELVEFTDEGPTATTVFSRADVGTIRAVDQMRDLLLLGGSRGLMVTSADGKDLHRVMRRGIHGLAAAGDVVVFSDGETLFLSTLALLKEQRILGQLRLGREFGLTRIKGFGTMAVAMGESATLMLDLSNPRQPRVASHLRVQDVGQVRDVAQLRGRLFLIGERGLQLLDPSGHHVVDSVDVVARERLSTMGRYLVVVGDDDLQVVDATPFMARYGAAASSE